MGLLGDAGVGVVEVGMQLPNLSHRIVNRLDLVRRECPHRQAVCLIRCERNLRLEGTVDYCRPPGADALEPDDGDKASMELVATEDSKVPIGVAGMCASSIHDLDDALIAHHRLP